MEEPLPDGWSRGRLLSIWRPSLHAPCPRWQFALCLDATPSLPAAEYDETYGQFYYYDSATGTACNIATLQHAGHDAYVQLALQRQLARRGDTFGAARYRTLQRRMLQRAHRAAARTNAAQRVLLLVVASQRSTLQRAAQPAATQHNRCQRSQRSSLRRIATGTSTWQRPRRADVPDAALDGSRCTEKPDSPAAYVRARRTATVYRKLQRRTPRCDAAGHATRCKADALQGQPKTVQRSPARCDTAQYIRRDTVQHASLTADLHGHARPRAPAPNACTRAHAGLRRRCVRLFRDLGRAPSFSSSEPAVQPVAIVPCSTM
jgi:hypothetical protein